MKASKITGQSSSTLLCISLMKAPPPKSSDQTMDN